MLDGVDHQLDGRLWRVNELILTVELFQNVVLQRSAKMVPRKSLPPSHGEIHGPNHCCGPVDGLRDRDFVERNIGVQPLHVFDGVNGHTHRPLHQHSMDHLNHAPSRWGDQKPSTNQCSLSCPARFQQILESPIGVVGRTKAGKLTHGPEPGAVHPFVDTTSKWVLARLANTWMGLAHIIRMGGLNRVGP